MDWQEYDLTKPGQGSGLQDWLIVSLPTQSVPLHEAGGDFVLFLTWVPFPQVKEQDSHAPQGPHSQFTV